MPVRRIADTGFEYFLVAFDANGKEVKEADGSLLSETIRKRLAMRKKAITDVFLASHGWKGDIPAAIEQFDKWFGTMASMKKDIADIRQRRPDFEPLIIGLHWPSLPWGDESAPVAKSKGKSKLLGSDAEDEVNANACAVQIADTERARTAIRSILAFARTADSTALPAAIRDAYATLFAESGLRVGSVAGRPGSDHADFDPVKVIGSALPKSERPAVNRTLGRQNVVGSVRDAILMPLRQLSFWKMKDRARAFGESGAHDLVKLLQSTKPDARFHLMGHSFGCIVVSAAVAGPLGTARSSLPRPVDSMYLVQGALSLWSFAADIPYAPNYLGYFNRISIQGLVRGPLVTTQSKYDTAVGTFYPLGAEAAGELLLGERYPAYGGIGTFGIRGTRDVTDIRMGSSDFAYHFSRGKFYNLEASNVIKNGTGASGAHNDIAHPEVAHAFWAAVAAGYPAAVRSGSRRAAAPRRTPGDLPDSDLGLQFMETFRAPGDADTLSASHDGVLGVRSVQGRTRGPGLLDGTEMLPIEPVKPARWVNAEIEGRAPNKALAVGKWYTLAFDVDVKLRRTSVAGQIFEGEHLFPEGVDEIVLTVQLETVNFELSGQKAELRLAREGRSHTKARFDLLPLHDGPATITATITKDGNFVQQMELTFQIGAKGATKVKVESRGRALPNINVLQNRTVSLIITRIEGGYNCIVCGAVASSARLQFEPAYLANAIDAARDDLMKVVTYETTKGFVFQEGINISAKDCAFALQTMAYAGATLFRKLFYAPGATADSMKIGDFLSKLSSQNDERLKLQIVAERTTIPWGLLYVGPVTDGATLDWDNFLGMRHVIEQIPLQTSLAVLDHGIRSDPRLAVSVNLNDTIDDQTDRRFVQQQLSFWNAAGVSLTARTTSEQLVRALGDGQTSDQIIYLYCHATSKGLNDPGGPDASNLGLSDALVTLGELHRRAPVSTQLKGNPLVFINACESAEMSPAFYDGFVPYFMDKGARGVIGTECKIPAYFAMEWAQQFFARFLVGQPLGAAFFDLRREFLLKRRNPLGLLYAVHCDADTLVRPAVGLPAKVASHPAKGKAQMQTKRSAPRSPHTQTRKPANK